VKASFNWLKEFVDIELTPTEVADALTMAGLEVETVEEVGAEFQGVTVAQILSIEKHPNADRLSVCNIKSNDARRKIVCGATNIAAGQRVPLALPGAKLPGGMEIKRTTIRGVGSEGMICSEVELGLGDDTSGIMLLEDDAPLGMDLSDYLGLKDYIFDIGVTPNRSDCFGILGIARDIAAITGKPLRKRPIRFTEVRGRKIEELVSVEVELPSFCSRYSARVIEGVTIGPSPLWLERRLALHGIRAVNNIVDVTNYVMLEYSQPLHAFDYDLIEGRKIAVRPGGEGESIETIDGSKVPLSKDIPVIADGAGPVAIAGVMGGKRSEISESTRNILLECAFFKSGTVRMVSRSLGIASESSFRFERGVDIEAIGIAIDRAAEMILKLGGGTLVKGAVDIYPERFKPAQITLSRERVNALLGTALTMTTIKGALKRLGIATRSAQKRGTIVAEPPSYRLDIGMEADLIEEVARLTSYENIPSTLPKGAIAPSRRERPREVKRVVREILTNLGLYEVINYSFVGENTARVDGSESGSGIRLINPLSEEQVLLRKHIFPSLLENLRYNLNRENRDVRIFEIGRAFTAKENQSREREYISALLYGERYGTNWSHPRGAVDFYDVKGLLESLMAGLLTEGVRFERAGDAPFLHPGKSAKLFLGDEEAGFVGEVHPTTLDDLDIEGDAFIFELSLDILVRHSSSFMRHGSVPRYPAVKRDISFIVDRAVDYEAISSYIMGVDEIIIEGVELFDVYCGGNIPADKVSMAIRVTYRSKDGTLTDGEVNQLHSRIVDGLSGQFKLEVRGVGTTPATV
jgi:phenylalanyl-tRNA synthetase beta chain